MNFFAQDRTDRQRRRLPGSRGLVPVDQSGRPRDRGAVLRGAVDLRSAAGAASRARPTKMAFGLVLVALGFVFMVLGGAAQRRRRAGQPVLAGRRLYVPHLRRALPVADRTVVRDQAGAARMVARLMGVWFFATAIGEFLAGQFAALTDKIARGEIFHLLGGQADFFLVLVVSPMVVAVALVALTPWLRGGCTGATCESRSRVARSCLLLSSAVAAAPSRPPRRDPQGRRRRPPPRRRRPRSVPLAGGRRRARGEALDRRAERRHAPGARPRSRPRRAGEPLLAALRDRLGRRRRCRAAEARQRAPLLLHAPRRQAEPARALRPRRRGRRATARWSTSTASAPTARARSTGGSRRTTARWSPTASPTTAARSRCCACATWRPGRICADEIPRTRACSLAWTPDGRGFYYTRYPAPGEVPAGEEKYHRAVFHHRLGDDPAQGPQAVRRRARQDRLARRRPVARRALAGDHGRARGGRRARSTSSICAPAAKPVAVAAGEPAKFSVVEMLDDRLYLFTTSGAPRGRLYAVDPARPERARWREADQAVRRGADGRRLLPRRSRGRLAARRGAAPAAVRRGREAARRDRTARARAR